MVSFLLVLSLRKAQKVLGQGLTVDDIRAELAFLRLIDSQPVIYSQPVVQRAIYR